MSHWEKTFVHEKMIGLLAALFFPTLLENLGKVENRDVKKDLEQLDSILKDKGISRRDAIKMLGLGGAAMAELLEHLQADNPTTGTDEQNEAVSRLILLLQSFQPAGQLTDPVFMDNSSTKNSLSKSGITEYSCAY